MHLMSAVLAKGGSKGHVLGFQLGEMEPGKSEWSGQRPQSN